jgi:hypothetical protein
MQVTPADAEKLSMQDLRRAGTHTLFMLYSRFTHALLTLYSCLTHALFTLYSRFTYVRRAVDVEVSADNLEVVIAGDFDEEELERSVLRY